MDSESNLKQEKQRGDEVQSQRERQGVKRPGRKTETEKELW